eukprot:UN00762
MKFVSIISILVCVMNVMNASRLLQGQCDPTTNVCCANLKLTACQTCRDRPNGAQISTTNGCCVSDSDCGENEGCVDNECEAPCSYTEEYNPYCCGTTTYTSPGQAACDGLDVNKRKDGCQQGECCGGFGGLACPSNKVCVDIANDDCDPNNGGADCMGSCQ